MAYTTNEKWGTITRGVDQLRVEPREIQPKTFAPVVGGATLARLTPVAYDTTLNKWVVWTALAREAEVQSFDLTGATGGKFKLTFDGQTTAPIAYNANAATVQAALEALPNVQPGDIVCSGGPLPGTQVVLTFGGQWLYKNVPQITITEATDEVQTVTIDATGGTFTLAYAGVVSGALAYNISAANLKTALEALAGIMAGDLTVTLDTAVYTITFGGSLAGKNVPVLVSNPANLTGGASTAVVATSVAGGSMPGPAVVTIETDNAGVADTGRADVRGFIWPDEVTLDNASVGNKDVLAQVLLAGRVHYGDIVLPAGESENDLKTALRSGCRERGLWIEGLTQVR